MTMMTTHLPSLTLDFLSETERTDSTDRLCGACGTPLRDRRPQARFCSDRCRTQAGRNGQRQRIAAVLDALAEGVHELRQELGIDGTDEPEAD
jgi:predicted nucleic acid-binding Zn ribbon protein